MLISGSEGESVGLVDYWARLFSPAEPTGPAAERGADRNAIQRSAVHGWQDPVHEVSGRRRPNLYVTNELWNAGDAPPFSQELYDYGGGIPNELVIVLERCAGLSTRWPGLFPDAYLTYRFYDLPPRVSPTARCSADPVFDDTASYALAVTADVLRYLRYDGGVAGPSGGRLDFTPAASALLQIQQLVGVCV